MATENEIVRPPKTIPSEGFPNVYANVASLTVGFHDIRVYFGESYPEELVTERSATPHKVKKAVVSPRICLVMSPEFARAVKNALELSLSNYEQQFGQLRPDPKQNPSDSA